MLGLLMNDRNLSSQAAEVELVAIQPRLNGLAGEFGREGLENAEYTSDGDELRVKLLTKHARRNVVPGSRHGTPAKWAVDVHTTVRHNLRARTHGGRHNEIAITRVDPLTRTNGLVMHEGGHPRRFRGRLGRLLHHRNILVLGTKVGEHR